MSIIATLKKNNYFYGYLGNNLACIFTKHTYKTCWIRFSLRCFLLNSFTLSGEKFLITTMKNQLQRWILCIGATMGYGLSLSSAHANNMYVYQDGNGGTILTNKKLDDRSLQQIKVTRYQSSPISLNSYSSNGYSGASNFAASNSTSAHRNSFDHIIRQASQSYGVAEGLIKAVMHTESGFKVNARSPVGAQGLMQLMPATARRFNVSNAYDPYQNIMAGAKYLSWLLKRFKGNTSLALAGYNAGEGNVDKYGGIPPFTETRNYVQRVTGRYNSLYANGLGSSAGGNNYAGQISTASSSNSGNTQASSYTAPALAPQREIIMLADGSFSDIPSRSYANNAASASARISFSD